MYIKHMVNYRESHIRKNFLICTWTYGTYSASVISLYYLPIWDKINVYSYYYQPLAGSIKEYLFRVLCKSYEARDKIRERETVISISYSHVKNIYTHKNRCVRHHIHTIHSCDQNWVYLICLFLYHISLL